MSSLSRWCLFLGCLLVLLGGFVAWPLLSAVVHYKVVGGRILDVFTEPLPDGHVRLTIAYDYPVPSKIGKATAIGHDQADRNLHRVPEVILTPSQAEEAEHRLRGAPYTRRVFIDVNKPYDSAFMMTGLGTGHGLSVDQGIWVIVAGLLLWSIGFSVRKRSP